MDVFFVKGDSVSVCVFLVVFSYFEFEVINFWGMLVRSVLFGFGVYW